MNDTIWYLSLSDLHHLVRSSLVAIHNWSWNSPKGNSRAKGQGQRQRDSQGCGAGNKGGRVRLTRFLQGRKCPDWKPSG